MNLKKIGRVVENRAVIPGRLDITALRPGLNQTDDLLVYVGASGSVERVFDRICDHNGGRLFAVNKCNFARCPMHGWELDVTTGKYENVGISKKPIAYALDGNFLSYETQTIEIDLPQLSGVSPPVSVRFINHAFVVVDLPGVRFITDPWALGPAFCTGWWLNMPTKADWIEVANASDFIYVSHNHPDHLHLETLSHINPEIPVLTGNFLTGATAKMLREAGRTNVLAIEFGDVFRFGETDLVLTILKSGDFREDSGLFFTVGSFKALLTVDSNNLNFSNLPSPVTLLATSFASGASGYPVCFDMYTTDNKLRLLARNRSSVRSTVASIIRKTKPQFYLPYAGFFSEKAERDTPIRILNAKNSIDDYVSICAEASANLLDVRANDIFTFVGNKLANSAISGSPALPYSQPPAYISAFKKAYEGVDVNLVLEYFALSKFRDNLILFLHATNDDFSSAEKVFRVDFSGEHPLASVVMAEEADAEFFKEERLRVKRMCVRKESFLYVLTNFLPWEDLLIGFQCRINRRPDVYNSAFWFHFTNIYIANPSESHLIDSLAKSGLFA